MSRPQLIALEIADPPERWGALGFEVVDDRISLGGVEVRLGADGIGITAWTLTGLESEPDEIDGLPTWMQSVTSQGVNPIQVGSHPNGTVGLDHVVITTPDFDRTAAALEQAGMPLRRIRDAGNFRQGFRRLGPAIMEIVEAKGAPPGGARFWGLTVIATDLDALRDHLHPHLGEIKAAVQPGRQIATLQRSAGLGTRVAFMTPE